MNREILAAFLLGFSVTASIGLITSVEYFVLQRLINNKAEIAFVISLPYVFIPIFSFLLPLVSIRIGKKRIMVITCLLGALALLIKILARNLFTYLLSQPLISSFWSLGPILYGIVSKYEKERYIPYLIAVLSISGSIGSFLASFLSKMSVYAPLYLCFFTILAVTPASSFVREFRAKTIMYHLKRIKLKHIILILLGMSYYLQLYTKNIFWSPFYEKLFKNLAPPFLAISFSILGFSASVYAAIIGRIKLSRKFYLILPAYILLSIIYMIFPRLNSFLLLLPVLLLISLSESIVGCNYRVKLAESYEPEDKSPIFGVSTVVGYVISFISANILGIILEKFGIQTTFNFVSAFLLVVPTILFFAYKIEEKR